MENQPGAVGADVVGVSSRDSAFGGRNIDALSNAGQLLDPADKPG